MSTEHMKWKSKKWNVILKTSKGFVEALDSNRSFNIFSGSLQEKVYKFEQSCYKEDTAKRILSNLEPT